MRGEKPREYTRDEMVEIFLQQVHLIIRSWKTSTAVESDQCRLAGVAFSILAMLDGESASLPGFAVVPGAHADDKQWHIDQGENWWPGDVDLAGSLHELFHQYGPKGKANA